MAHIYKTIIIGATIDGIKLAESIASDDRSTLLLSKNFKYLKPKQILNNVELLEAEAIFMSYNHGLFGINIKTASGEGAVYGTNVVFATGTRPEKLNIADKHILYNEIDVTGKHKHEAAVVYGDGNIAGRYTINLAKRFAYVYLCTPGMDIGCTRAMQSRINNTANVLHLPNCTIASCKTDKNEKLVEVLLDTYSSIHAAAVVAATMRQPDLPSFAKKYLKLDESGYALPITAKNAVVIPGAYALGAVCNKHTAKELTKLTNILL